MKKTQYNFPLILAGLCLLTIGGVLASGILKNKPAKIQEQSVSQVLGENIEPIVNPTGVSSLNRFFQDTFENTKEVVSEKVVQIEKQIVQSVEKEVVNLSQAQIEALKLQICKDLGVISISPTGKP